MPNNSLEYKNEAGEDPPDKPLPGDNTSEMDEQTRFSLLTYTTHHITMEGITFYTEEFRIDNRETEAATNTKPTETDQSMANEQFYSTTELPETEQCQISVEPENEQSDSDTEDDQQLPAAYHSDQIKFGEITGKQEIRITMKVFTLNCGGERNSLKSNSICSKVKTFPDQKFSYNYT